MDERIRFGQAKRVVTRRRREDETIREIMDELGIAKTLENARLVYVLNGWVGVVWYQTLASRTGE